MKSGPKTKCWNWLKSKQHRGYGNVRYDGKWRMAHRVAYYTTKGPIPEGNVVMHICDNPSCVNPKHLKTGTQSDNLRDMMAKGRRKYPSKYKYPLKTRIAIIKAYAKGARIIDLSRKYGVPATTTGYICRGGMPKCG